MLTIVACVQALSRWGCGGAHHPAWSPGAPRESLYAGYNNSGITNQYKEPLCKKDPDITNDILQLDKSKMYEKEPRYNEPLCNKDPGITNDILQPNNGKMYGKEPRYNNPLCNEGPGTTNDILQPRTPI